MSPEIVVTFTAVFEQFAFWGGGAALIVGGIWATSKAVHWLARTFFPGLVKFARGVVETAESVEAFRELPGFMERTDQQFELITGQVADIHHEIHLNSGKSIKDTTIRTENRVKRIETALGIEDDEQAVAPR
jgi:hypothetical protein